MKLYVKEPTKSKEKKIGFYLEQDDKGRIMLKDTLNFTIGALETAISSSGVKIRLNLFSGICAEEYFKDYDGAIKTVVSSRNTKLN